MTVDVSAKRQKTIPTKEDAKGKSRKEHEIKKRKKESLTGGG